MTKLLEGKDFYWEGTLMVFTADYHARKGKCCGSGCRHCPYQPRHQKGSTRLAAEAQASTDESCMSPEQDRKKPYS